MNVLIPADLAKEVKIEHKAYTKIEDEIYSQFWDIIVVENKKDLDVALKFKEPNEILYVGDEETEDAIRISKADVELFIDLLMKIQQRENEIEILKKNQDLLFEPINLSSKMSASYDKLAKITKSRVSIVIAKDGLLEEWILSKTIGNHETFDFSSVQEEEIMLDLFGSKNHVAKLLETVVIVLMNCDTVPSALLLRVGMAASMGRFSLYGSNENLQCNSRILFHFTDFKNIPKPLLQISGQNFVEIPTLSEITEDIPIIFRYTISTMVQNLKYSSLNFSEDLTEILKKESWPQNWRSFFAFCKAFTSGEVSIRQNIQEISEFPKMKDYISGIVQESEKTLIRKAMEIYKGNKKQVCDVLGINIKTLNKKLKIYNLK